MPKVNIPFTGLYQSQSPVIANIQCENFYLNIPQTGGALSQATMRGTPGIDYIDTTGEGSANTCRGAHTKNGIPYFVNGNALFKIVRTFDESSNEILTVTSLGVIEGTNFVSMADNGKQLMVLVPGGKGYIYNEDDATPFQEITDPDFTANGLPQYVEFIDSFFIVTTDSKKFIKSASNDGLSWNALDFATAEADPDNIVAPINFKNQLYISGSETFEVFQNLGVGGFPFQRINGFIINKGVIAPQSLVQNNDAFYFIGGGTNESPAVWAVQGSSAIKISNTAIEYQLQQYSTEEISQAVSFSYAQNGAYFVCFSLPNRTFCYETVSQQWHERTSTFINELGDRVKVRWRVNALTTAYNRIFVGDSQDGRIGVLDDNTYQEYSNDILRVFTPVLVQTGEAFSVTELELTVESGVATADIPEPSIRLEFSEDSKTWTDELWRCVGKIGRYKDRVIWNRVGRFARFVVFRIMMSDPVKPEIISLDARIRQGQRGR